ncbi:hypothetical protein FOC1_g10008900 [Fusarium oxysporum f. sp. cubense race 1]|uniref:Uncharacterized protein n=1 Tax=Fusarium oxysporum f. sp. cubense (strain race 1) TaxID=1229664 RepID=N4UDW0_FUSC1|nr:hypothetical protein FOC1_g10008900 [Fusarium oxysporum f. sp. cubense race 1]
MHFSSLIPALGGLVAVATASPHLLPGVGLGLDVDVSLGGKGAEASKPVDTTSKGLDLVPTKAPVSQKGGLPSTCSLANSWENHVLFDGIAAPASGAAAAIKLGLNLPNAQIEGDATLELVKDFLQEPRVRIGLGAIKAYVELDISASAAVHESIELFASSALQLEIPGLLEAEAGAALALDLVVGVDAAIDLSAGVYLAFGEEAFVEVSLITKEIVDVSLEGLVAKALPIGVAAEVDLSAEVSLTLGLRLRTEIDLEAELDIPVLDIEAGAKIAVWVSLFEYTAVLIATDNCAVSVDELIALTLGLAVELNVEVGDILDISLAPTLTITLATAAQAKVCQPNRGTPGNFIEKHGRPATTHTQVVSLSTVPAGGSDSTMDSALPDATGSADASGSADVTGSATADSSDAYPVPGATGSETYPAGAYPAGPGSSSALAKPHTTGSAAAIVPVHGNGTATGDVTSTVTSTHVYTVTSCAASVINCPARYTQKVVTSTIIESTYVCPATETGAVPATTTAHSTKVHVPVTTITDTLTTIVPCKTRTTKTFHPPTTPPPAPTVTIVDTTTYCPEEGKTAQPSKGQSTFQVVTTASPSTKAYEVPSHAAPTTEAPVPEKPTAGYPTPEKPTGGKPVAPPAHSVPYPPSNGTVSTHVPVYPAPVPTTAVPVVPAPVPTAGYAPPPAVSQPGVVPPPAAETPVATPVGTTPVPVSGASVVRTGFMLALPAALALFM